MFIVGRDIEEVRNTLLQASAEGNDWVVFPTDQILQDSERLLLFQKQTDAENFCFIHGAMGENVACGEISVLVDQINHVAKPDSETADIDYYLFLEKDVYTSRGKFSEDSSLPEQTLLSASGLQYLIEHPLKEFLSDEATGKLIERLQQFGEASVQVERTIVPANHIEEYVIVRHHYPSGGTVYEQGHGLETLETVINYEEAQKQFNQLVTRPPVNETELVLIGRYEGKVLQYDLEGNPDPSTGYRAVGAYIGDNEKNEKEYRTHWFNDPRLPTVIRENLKAETGASREGLYFSDVYGGVKKVDISFWQEQSPPLENFNSLSRQLDHLQFKELKEQLEQHFWDNKNAFIVSADKVFGEDCMHYDLKYQRDQNGFFRLEKFDATLQKAIRIEGETSNGVAIKDLEKRMRTIDWKVDSANVTDNKQLLARSMVTEDLQKLDPRTRMYFKAKFWADSAKLSADEMIIVGLLTQSNRYKQTVHCRGHFDALNADQTFQSLLKHSIQMEKLLDSVSKKHFSNINQSVMNKDNFEYLKNSLKYSGFGEDLNAQLEAKLMSKVPEFTLTLQKEMKNREMEAVLYFRKGNEGEMYFFNKYDATLTKANAQQLQQTFYMDNGRGFTFKEAYNMLDGRAVFKDLVNQQKENYTAWVKLDFTKQKDNGGYEMSRYTSGYGYDLTTALEKLNPKELLDASKRQDLIKSLERGNVQAVTLSTGEQGWIAANPESGKGNKLLKYDENGREVTVEVRNVPVGVNKEDKENNTAKMKNTTVADDETGEKTNKKKQKSGKQAVDNQNGLLQKKREGTQGKGQRV